VIGNHDASGSTVVDEDTGLRRLEADGRLFPGIDEGESRTTQGTGHGVEVDVVAHDVRGRAALPARGVLDAAAPVPGIDQCELHVVVLMNHDDGTGNTSLERQRIDRRAQGVDDELPLFHHHPDLDDLRAALRLL
jgi:hypothetical protein